MNRSYHLIPILVGLLILGGCVHEHHTTVTLNDDGSVSVAAITVVDHQQVLAMLDGHHHMSGPRIDIVEEEEDEIDSATTPDNDDLAATLLTRLREQMARENPFLDDDEASMSIDEISIDGQRATITTTMLFTTPAAFARHGQHIFTFMAWRGLSLSVDDDDLLELSLIGIPSEFRQQMQPQMRQQMTQEEVSASLTIVMPGDITESGLPEYDGRGTSIAFRHDDDESLDTFFAHAGRSTTIRSARGSFPVETLPVRSENDRFGGHIENDPIDPDEQAAEPESPETLGFRVEPHTVMLRQTIALQKKEDEDAAAQRMHHYHHQPSTLKCRIHPPPGVTIARISNARVISAIDDQDRELVDDAHTNHSSTSYGSSSSQSHRDFDVNVPAIPPDSEAIEQFIGEVTIDTISGMGEHDIGVITTALADAEQRHSLDDVLPGAYVVISEVTRETDDNGQQLKGNITLSISGPAAKTPEIKNIEFAIVNQLDGQNSHGHAWMRQNSHDSTDGVYTRSGTLDWQLWSHQGAMEPVLRLKVPQGPQSHRLRFTLSALDLP